MDLGAEAPDLNAIEADLVLYRRFREALLRGDKTRPPLPDRGKDSGLVRGVVGVLVHLGLFLVGEVARRTGAPGTSVWAAQREVELDYLWYEPIACGLNHAYTRLGLSLIASGHTAGAARCLRASWHVYPCPHSTSFGLDRRLRAALSDTEDAVESVAEYEAVERKYSSIGHSSRRHP